MARDFTPAPADLLCERCGYLLNGLPDVGACPECGKPVAESTSASPRRPPAWEGGTDRGPARFQFTAAGVLRNPKQFFRSMTSHGDTARSARFGRLAILPAMLFNTKTVLMHIFVMYFVVHWPAREVLPIALVVTPVAVVLIWLGMYFAVVRLTTVESRYWHMRLPAEVVRRALHYDAIYASAFSLLPWAVSLIYLCAVVASDRAGGYLSAYLYVLSAAVVVAAVGMFFVYATTMRSLMYANR